MTIRELAKLINVSPAAISIVINGKKGVSEKTREKILKAMEEYNYLPPVRKHTAIKNVLLIKFTKTGYFVEENQGFISMIIDAAEGRLRQNNIAVTLLTVKNRLADDLRSIDYEKFCAAIVVGTEMGEEEYRLLKEISIPFVVVDNVVPHYRYSSVAINNCENVYLALRHLSDCGHRKLGYIGSKFETENFKERRKGFMSAIVELGLSLDEENDYRVTPTMVGAHDDFLECLSEEKKMPSAFFVENDTLALGVMKALKEKGYKIPEDVSVIGFDDIPYSSISSPTLTTVHVQRKVIGKQAADQLLNLLENKGINSAKMSIIGKLVVRGSVKKL